MHPLWPGVGASLQVGAGEKGWSHATRAVQKGVETQKTCPPQTAPKHVPTRWRAQPISGVRAPRSMLPKPPCSKLLPKPPWTRIQPGGMQCPHALSGLVEKQSSTRAGCPCDAVETAGAPAGGARVRVLQRLSRAPADCQAAHAPADCQTGGAPVSPYAATGRGCVLRRGGGRACGASAGHYGRSSLSWQPGSDMARLSV